jgi:hypothetical protein
MAELVYVLCAATCLLCMLLLGRGYLRTRQRILMWATLCFTALFANNVVTFVDLVLVPDLDLTWLRSSLGFIGVALLAVGLVWEKP